MSTTLLDAPAHLLDLPPQQLGPKAVTKLRTHSRGPTNYTDRGRGEFRQNRRGAPAAS